MKSRFFLMLSCATFMLTGCTLSRSFNEGRTLSTGDGKIGVGYTPLYSAADSTSDTGPVGVHVRYGVWDRLEVGAGFTGRDVYAEARVQWLGSQVSPFAASLGFRYGSFRDQVGGVASSSFQPVMVPEQTFSYYPTRWLGATLGHRLYFWGELAEGEYTRYRSSTFLSARLGDRWGVWAEGQLQNVAYGPTPNLGVGSFTVGLFYKYRIWWPRYGTPQ